MNTEEGLIVTLPYTTIRIWTLTKKLAKRLAVESGETLVAFLHRIVLAEQARTAQPRPQDAPR